MTPRGVGTRCPQAVAELLRLYGWAGASGWWSHPEESDRALRWWDALHLAMNRERGSVRARDRGPAAEGRCRRTADMFH